MKKELLILLLILALLTAAGCSASGTPTTALNSDTQAVSAESIAPGSTENPEQTAAITLNGSTASAEGDGVSIDGNTVTIITGGVYTLTGTLNGQIVVEAGKDDAVELVLSGVSVTSAESAAIYCKQADKLIVTMAENTVNILRGASSYQSADAAEGEPDAALFSKDDLTICGMGALAVYSNDKNGIVTKDDLVIKSGTISVQAMNHGIRGKDSVTIAGGTVTIDAGNDGVQSDNAGDAAKGYILIQGGTVTITAAHDGLQAQTLLTIAGGGISITTGGGYTTENDSPDESCKALKSAGDIEISGGTLTANSLDDAIHANGTVTVSNGALLLMSRDDGIHADETVSITGGTVDIPICYEGLESTVLNIGGGVITIRATDDGINAADPEAGGQSSGSESLQVNISGGSVTINAYGDGVDSNGVINMSGGALYVSGPVSPQNGAIDYDGSFSISGGVLAAAGAAGMAQAPSSNSSQPSVFLSFSQPQAAGSAYILTDANDTVLLSYTPDKDFQCIVFSVPELSQGSSCRIYKSTDGTLSGAALLYDVTLSGTITSVGGAGAQTMQTWDTQHNNMQPPQQRRP